MKEIHESSKMTLKTQKSLKSKIKKGTYVCEDCFVEDVVEEGKREEGRGEEREGEREREKERDGERMSQRQRLVYRLYV